MKDTSNPQNASASDTPRAKRTSQKRAARAAGPTPDAERTGASPARAAETQADNAIRPFKRRRRAEAPAAAGTSDARGAPTAAAKAADGGAASTAAPSRQNRAMPEEIWERFIGIGSKYYFPDGTPAFVDRGTRLTTPSENTEVVRSLVTIAQARGWEGITVTGTERFRREAWFAAQRAGLQLRGYEASAVEHAQLARALAAQPSRGRSAAGAENAAERPRAIRRDAAPRGYDADGPSRRRREPVFTGRLLDHGRAPYRHDPHEPTSYYVRLQTKDGEREVWGVDLERAVRQSLSSASIGDDVTVRAVSRQPVTVPAAERDAEGRVVAQKAIETHRNAWIVERSDFLAGRERLARVFRNESVPAQEAVKQHPELQGSYLKLQAVKLGAERDFKDPAERARLLARARVLIAESIDRGEPLEPVRLRERRPEPARARSEPERSR